MDIYSTLSKLIKHEQSARKIGSILEAEAFAEKIQELLIRHKLSMSDVKASDVKPETPVGEHTIMAESLGYGNLKKRWSYLIHLAGVVADAHFCRIMISAWGHTIYFVGKEEDRRLTEDLFRYLAILGIELGHKAILKYDGSSERWPFLKSFYTGYVFAIGTRYREQKHRIEESESQAIVLFKVSSEALDHYVSQRTTRGKARRSRIGEGSMDGYLQGRAAGNSVALTSKTLERGE